MFSRRTSSRRFRLFVFLLGLYCPCFAEVMKIPELTNELAEETIVRPGESYLVEEYGDLGASEQASLVCRYNFRGEEKTRVYWYAPHDIMGKSYCPGSFTKDASLNDVSLFRGGAVEGSPHLHIATFNADQSNEYNRENCEIAARLFTSQPGVTVRYWYE